MDRGGILGDRREWIGRTFHGKPYNLRLPFLNKESFQKRRPHLASHKPASPNINSANGLSNDARASSIAYPQIGIELALAGPHYEHAHSQCPTEPIEAHSEPWRRAMNLSRMSILAALAVLALPSSAAQAG